MVLNFKNGYDFISANPTLHARAKHLALPPQANTMLTTFSHLMNEITDEFIRFLRSKFKDIKFINAHLPKSMKLEPKMTLPTLLSHCFPIMYGLQQRSENSYQKKVNLYLKSRMSDTENKMKEKVALLIHIFHEITQAQQVLHTIAKTTEMSALDYTRSDQLSLLTKEKIQHHCNSLSHAFKQCRLNVATTSKEKNILSGLISRTTGFSSFTEKKLAAFCQQDEIA
jgi:hypothetical protein